MSTGLKIRNLIAPPQIACALWLVVMLCSIYACQPVQAQLLDDTTKNTYGPLTTKYFLEKDIFYNRKTLYPTDTSLDNFFLAGDYIHGQVPRANLGVLGTATNPLIFQLPTQIGTTLGQDVLTPYAFNPAEIPYYNTRSPASRVLYVQGGRPRQILQTMFTRNFSPLINVGMDYKRIAALRTINITEAEQRQVDHHSLVLNGSYISENRRYMALVNYTHFNHKIFETGGVRGNAQTPKDSLFAFEIALARLNKNAANREIRNNWHLYHQYQIDQNGMLQIFHIADHVRQINRYGDPVPNTAFYANTGPQLPTYDRISLTRQYQLLENKAGAKGQLGKFNFAAFLRHKTFRYYADPVSFSGVRQELFTGGMLEFRQKDSSFVHIDGEIMPTRDFLLSGEISYPFAHIKGGLMRYAPTLLQLGFFSPPLIYNNNPEFGFTGNFDFTDARYINAELILKYNKIKIAPFLNLYSLSNYIFFNNQFRPQQVSSGILVQNSGMELQHATNRFKQAHKFMLNTVTGVSAIRMPPQMYQGMFMYQNLIRGNKAVEYRFGLTLQWLNGWYAYNYQPLNMQFYVQDEVLLQPFFLLEPFAELKIQKVLLYFKVHNANQGLGTPGYFMVPYYPAQRRLFEFGVKWFFYD